MEAQTKQTKDHNEKQDDVSGEGCENVELEIMRVERRTRKPRGLYSAGLGRNESPEIQL